MGFVKLSEQLLNKMPLCKDPRYEDYLLYILVDPTDNTVRYVGKTNDILRRWSEHQNGSKVNKGLQEWIKGLTKKGLRPDFHIVGNAGKHNWQQYERSLIAYFRSKGELYNIHEGGAFKIGKTKHKKPKEKRKTKINSKGYIIK